MHFNMINAFFKRTRNLKQHSKPSFFYDLEASR